MCPYTNSGLECDDWQHCDECGIFQGWLEDDREYDIDDWYDEEDTDEE